MGELGLDGHPVPGGGRRRRRRLAASTRSPSRSSRASTRRWPSRCAPTPRWAPSRSTCSAATSRRQRLLPDLCAGRQLGAFGLTEPEAGSDAGNVQHARRRSTAASGSIDGAKQFITNAGTDISGHVAITARTGDRRDLQPHRRERHPGLRAGRAVPQDGVERVRHAAAELRRLPRARGEPARPARRGLQAVPAHPRHRPHRRRRDGRRPRPGRAGRGAEVRQGAQGVRQADREVPDDPGQARRHGDRDRGRAAARPTRPRCSRTRAATSR